ncbi:MULTISPECIES: erythromycin resistance leader peptide [Bacillales]|nr:erythromycin resistance leader peptide [Bacillus sp. NSP9.1]QNG61869.1 erythromycin resistance leader peptide [Bacillus sp. PAMC26568]
MTHSMRLRFPTLNR